MGASTLSRKGMAASSKNLVVSVFYNKLLKICKKNKIIVWVYKDLSIGYFASDNLRECREAIKTAVKKLREQGVNVDVPGEVMKILSMRRRMQAH